MQKAFPELWILRHGETEWNVLGRLQGQFDSALTSKGLAQSTRQAGILKLELSEKEVRVYSSPAGRALRTAQIAASGLAVECHPALQEINIGTWQGMTVAEIKLAHPELDHADDPHVWKFQAPQGERIEQMKARLERFLENLTGPSVIVTHGVTSRMLRCLVLGLDVSNMSLVPGGQGIVHHIKDGQAQVLQ
ncbi:Phosphoserine phosphatase 1 [Roseovarius albus]|uniref:Phosphoserine phosphatase 1 n=1 Tax=Roseovarius albus TaxID=1247867 RepID=A0A1X6Z933_9RHOB|nr:histidine phosphatase family protein [Roseovarius albus]SLN43911.1 Phosphoserine phosphatase 1 [Roseovarius albus]